MDLENVLSLEGGTVRIEVTASDLAAFGETIARKVAEEVTGMLKGEIEKSREELDRCNEENLWSATQVCRRLNISKSTLWLWSQKGILVPAKIGGLNKYDPAKIKALIDRKRPEMVKDPEWLAVKAVKMANLKRKGGES